MRASIWRLLPHALLALVLVIASGFGLYAAGPWRLLASILAAALAIAFALRQLAGRDAFPGTHASGLLWLLALGALAGSWGFAATPRLLTGLHVSLLVLPTLLGVLALAGSEGRAAARLHAVAWPLMLAIAAAYYGAIVLEVPSPHVDVWDHLNRGARALLDARNPYSEPIPDFYAGRVHYGFDAPGFPYPPLVLSLAALARAAGLDVRVLLVACVLAGAVLVRWIALRRGWSPDASLLLGLLYLFVPRLSVVVEYAHSEPISGLLFAAAVHAAVTGRSAVAAVLMGLFVSSKQYLVVTAPLLLLACPGAREALALLAAASLPWLPFALWDPWALWNAAFAVHLGRPVRPDALTLNAWLLARGQNPLPRWLPVASGVLTAVACGARRGLDVASLCLGAAGVLLVTFLTSPQAFGNYYALVAWLLVIGLAATPAPGSRTPAAGR